MIENLVDQYISDTYGLVVQYESGSFYDGFGNFIQNVGSGSSTINTGSFATTGSNVFRGNQTITGSLLITGSTTQIGNNTLTGNTSLTGSVNISGSTTIFGTTIFRNSSTTITGSLLVTGSTTQIGNNNLFGNTTLSGSLIISGAAGTGTPNIQIYGDTDFNGYIQLNPITSNINNNISASYIYVSGSTQDLYFSQNGSGYANTTRLRWLESNLYTGILSGGIITSTPGSKTWNISAGTGIIVTQNAATSSSPFPTVQYITWNDITNIPITYSGSAKLTYVGLNNTATPVQQVVPWGSTDINQYDTQINLGVVLHLSGSVSTGVFSSPQISYGSQQKADDFFRAFGPLKISGHTLQASGSSPTLSIKKTGGSAYKEGANYRFNANHPSTTVENDINTSKIYRYYISGSTPVIDTGVNNAGYTEIDSKYYVDTTTGTLALTGGAYWSIQRVFWIPNSPTNAFIVYYGNDRYRSLVDATNAKDSEPFIEAPNTATNAIFLGYIIIQGGGSGNPPRDLLNASEATIIPGGIFRNVGGIGSSGTSPLSNTLAGLSDVSIPGKVDGDLLYYNGSQWVNSKSLTGNYSISGSFTTNDGITAATVTANSFTGSLLGTASYASNADLLDGLNSTVFATTGSNTFRGNQTITGSLILSSSADTELTVIGNSVFTGSATVSIPPGTGFASSTALTLKNEATLGAPGTSIEFWAYNTEENQGFGIFKNSYISSNPYYYQGITFGNFPGTFKFNSFGTFDYTGSIATGSQFQPIGTTLFEINNSQVSSSLPITAASLTLGSGGNLTLGTNGVLIAPAVFNTQTTTYTLQSSDIGKTIEMNSGSANNLIIPLNLSTRIGFSVDVIQLGPGQTTISGSAGVTIRSAGGRTKLTSQYSAASLTQRALNEYYLVGDLTA